MKSLYNYIFEENQGSSFSNHVKFSLSDYNKWIKETNKSSEIEVDNDGDFDYIYISDKKNPKHIGTYNKKKQELYCDDIKLFGNYIN